MISSSLVNLLLEYILIKALHVITFTVYVSLIVIENL